MRTVFYSLIVFVIAGAARAGTVLSNMDAYDPGWNIAISASQFPAMGFQTGNGETFYDLATVTIRVDTVNSYSAPLELFIYDDLEGVPGDALGKLVASENPETPGDYTFAPVFPISLIAGTKYWVVAKSGEGGDYAWSMTDDNNDDSVDGWELGTSGVFVGQVSPNWIPLGYRYFLSISTSSVIPEPEAYALFFGAGMLGLVLIRRRSRMR